MLLSIIVKIFALDFHGLSDLPSQSSTIFQLPLPLSSIQPRCLPSWLSSQESHSRAPTRHCGSYCNQHCNQQAPICAFSGSLTSFGLSAWRMLSSACSDREGLFVELYNSKLNDKSTIPSTYLPWGPIKSGAQWGTLLTHLKDVVSCRLVFY